eukprot:scaffold274645_cov36-Prasinocladus_malaysianus.AAC.1
MEVSQCQYGINLDCEGNNRGFCLPHEDSKPCIQPVAGLMVEDCLPKNTIAALPPALCSCCRDCLWLARDLKSRLHS